MKADPMWGNIYLQFRSEDYGRKRLPGFTVFIHEDEGRSRDFADLDRALAYIRKLHDDNLSKGT